MQGIEKLWGCDFETVLDSMFCCKLPERAPDSEPTPVRDPSVGQQRYNFILKEPKPSPINIRKNYWLRSEVPLFLHLPFRHFYSSPCIISCILSPFHSKFCLF